MKYTTEQIEVMALDVRKIQGRGDLCQAFFQLLAQRADLLEALKNAQALMPCKMYEEAITKAEAAE